MRKTLLAVAALLAVTAPAVQLEAGQAAAPPRPVDKKDPLYLAANALGMLRSVREVDAIVRLEYWATGTLQHAGQAPIKLKEYRVGIGYGVPGMRVDYLSEAEGSRTIEVVNGTAAWNEETPGGKATPMPAASQERLLRLWTTPFGVVKAARQGGANTKVSTENGAIVLTCPVPGVSVTLKATLNAKHQVEKVQWTANGVANEIAYSEYGDLNDADYKADVLFPRRIVHRQGAQTVLDLTISKTNTYNPYVVFPVPDNVKGTRSGE